MTRSVWLAWYRGDIMNVVTTRTFRWSSIIWPEVSPGMNPSTSVGCPSNPVHTPFYLPFDHQALIHGTWQRSLTLYITDHWDLLILCMPRRLTYPYVPVSVFFYDSPLRSRASSRANDPTHDVTCYMTTTAINSQEECILYISLVSLLFFMVNNFQPQQHKQ